MRIFLVANSKFPRGGAISNYLQYLMLAIQRSGFKVYIISDVNPEFIQVQDSVVQYDDFTVLPFSISQSRIIRHFQYRSGFLHEKIRWLRDMKIDEKDIVILFSSTGILCKKLLAMQKKIGFRVAAGVLEMFDRDNLRCSARAYREYIRTLNELIPRFDLVIAVSTYIEDHYKRLGCDTFCLPPMADCQEFRIERKIRGKYNIILPANGKMKDDLAMMLKGFASLNPDELNGVILNLCGVREEAIREEISPEEYEKIRQSLVIHPWMQYDDLAALYQKMHFLILARGVSQMTLANFPSKIPETMAFGIVPICSEVGDYTKYYLRDGVDSIFIKGESCDACCEAIRRALNLSWDAYQTHSDNARNTAETKFDYRAWAPRIREALERRRE